MNPRLEELVRRVRMLLGNLSIAEIRDRVALPDDEFFLVYRAAETLNRHKD